MSSLQIIVHIAAILNLYSKPADFEVVILNGEMTEDVYVQQVPCFRETSVDYVFNLKKYLFGIKKIVVWNS